MVKMGGQAMILIEKTCPSKSSSVSEAELSYLKAGLNQPGGKLPLFDKNGQVIQNAIIRASMKKGLAEPWFANPLKPDWLVCRLTEKGRNLIS